MIDNVQFISIKEIASRLMRHPLLTDISLEAIIQYTLDFIGIMGLPNSLIDKTDELKVESYRAVLPCGLVSINQIRDRRSGICLRSSTDSFYQRQDCIQQNNLTFKVQGSIIYTTIKEGEIIISYQALVLDKHGYPMIPDNSSFLRALESYIKKEWFTILFDMNKISPSALQNAQQEYAWRAGQANMQFILPSMSEMESITNIMNQLLVRNNEFRSGFKSLGNKEHWRIQ